MSAQARLREARARVERAVDALADSELDVAYAALEQVVLDLSDLAEEVGRLVNERAGLRVRLAQVEAQARRLSEQVLALERAAPRDVPERARA